VTDDQHQQLAARISTDLEARTTTGSIVLVV
jgi:hypothetical protein